MAIAKKAVAKPAKKVAARPMKDTKKKDILPGKSPWERKAIKSGKAMTPVQVAMHKEFVKGKKTARANFAKGDFTKMSKSTVASDKEKTTAGYWKPIKPRIGTAAARIKAAGNYGYGKAKNKAYNKKFSAK